MLTEMLVAALGGQEGTVREMDVDMPVSGQDTKGVKGRRSPWSEEEDGRLKELVEEHGLKKWTVIASCLPGRDRKRCQERWSEHIDPDIQMGQWTLEEESTLIHAHRVYGTKWARMKALLPGRPPSMIKNHWNLKMQTRHAPLLFLCLVSAHVVLPGQVTSTYLSRY